MPQISPKSKVFYCFFGRWLGPSLSVPLNIRRGCCCFFEFLWSDVPADWLAYCCWRFSPTSFSRTVFPSSSLPRSESRLFWKTLPGPPTIELISHFCCWHNRIPFNWHFLHFCTHLKMYYNTISISKWITKHKSKVSLLILNSIFG